MTKKKVIIIGAVFLIILAAGVASFSIYKNINETPPVVVDQATSTSTEVAGTKNDNALIFSSAFIGVDDIHWGRGSLQVRQTTDGPVLSFKEDFEVAQGPDLFVYLSPNPAGQDLGEYASLGSLKAIRGSQQYTLPDNYASYKTAIIWCRAFGVTFATAELGN